MSLHSRRGLQGSAFYLDCPVQTQLLWKRPKNWFIFPSGGADCWILHVLNSCSVLGEDLA